MRHYHSMDELVAKLDEPNRSACGRILADHRARFATVRGGNNHHTWRGGYLDHVTEAMNVGVVLHEEMSALRPLPFSLSDLLLVVFLHDLEKPWRFVLGPNQELLLTPELAAKDTHPQFRLQKLAEYGVVLTPEQDNGLRYVEGEGADYTNQRRVMGPLAAMAHMCDVASARLWFDCPAAVADPWVGAARAAG
jgi:hypothetical protein